MQSISSHLFEQYFASIPRYTSYPTAPHFNESFKTSDYIEAAKRSNQTLLPRDLSIYVHIPFCHSLCSFCGCHKVICRTNHPKVDAYCAALAKELALRAQLFDADRTVTQVHLGGGTPNFLSTHQLGALLEQIAVNFHMSLSPNPEVSIELDPRVITVQGVRALANLGFNRFSVGVQDFSNEVQVAINRVQDERDTLAVIEAALQVGHSVNVDLITGLPHQSVASFEHTLDKVITCGVTRLAVYSFAYLPERIKAQRLIKQSHLPDLDTRIRMVLMTQEKLEQAGFVHIGLDHYAKSSDSLALAKANGTLQRNFQGYTTHARTDLIGLGVSAISQFNDCYAQNTTQLSGYQTQLEDGQLPIRKGFALNAEDLVRAHMIEQVMCGNTIDLSQRVLTLTDGMSKPASIDHTLGDYLHQELVNLKRMMNDELIQLKQDKLLINPLGGHFRRQIAAHFDAYLTPSPALCSNHVPNPSSTNSKNVIKFSSAL